MTVTRHDEPWIRHGLALLELSTGVLGATPVPARRAVRGFAEVARWLAERAPDWLAPWPVLEVQVPEDDRPLVAVSLERAGARLLVRESRPTPGSLGVTVALEYYLHLVHDHVRACRLAARRPGRVTALSPGEEAGLAEAFDEVDRVLHGGARDGLGALWGD
jgi:hypothetical protein